MNNIDDHDEVGNEDDEIDNNIQGQQFGDLKVNNKDMHDEQNEQHRDYEEPVDGDDNRNDVIDFDLRKHVV